MPIVDINEDEIVDVDDVALVLNGYGGTTDIYEGLWNGGRLVSVVGSASGFGSVRLRPGASVWGEGPSPRPKDDCLRSMLPDIPGAGLLPALLRGDAESNCSSCPSCDSVAGLPCYECEDEGQITGGEITASPEQPKPGDLVTFSWTPFELSGRTRKCKSSCGPEGTVCEIEDLVSSGWALEKKNPTTGEWDLIKRSADFPPGVAVPETIQQACAEVRLRLTSELYGATGNCAELQVEKIKEVQYADFEYETMCYADGEDRKRVGVYEFIQVRILPAGTAGIVRKVEGEGSLTQRFFNQDGGFYYYNFRAPVRPGNTKLSVTSGDCKKFIDFETIAPTGIKMYPDGVELHQQGLASAGFRFCMQVLPTDVSFRYIYVTELGAEDLEVTGDFVGADGFSNWEHRVWYGDVGCDNFVEGMDRAYSGALPIPLGGCAGGTWSVEIPWGWKIQPLGSVVQESIGFTRSIIFSELSQDGSMLHRKRILPDTGHSVSVELDAPTQGLVLDNDSQEWRPAYAECPNYSEPPADASLCGGN